MNKMREFELYLDESGNFIKDYEKKQRGWRPSLIGGILFEKNTLKKTEVDEIVGEKKIYHSTENKDCNEHMDKFKKLVEKNIEFVIFNNKEAVYIFNDEQTYLNIMANGITQLLADLKARYTKVHLNIFIAKRYSPTTEVHTTEEQYKNKLNEKILLESLQDVDGNKISKNWSVEIRDAKKEKKLMLADIVCNTYLTCETKLGVYKDYIKEVFDNKYKSKIYSVFVSGVARYTRQLLAEGRVGEAIIMLCQSKNEQDIENNIKDISTIMKNRRINDVERQYRHIATLMESYLDDNDTFDNCEVLAKNFLRFIIPIFEEIDKINGTSIAIRLRFDVNFYLFTLYTHEGKTKEAIEVEKMCDEDIKKLPIDVDYISLKVKYTNRKIINIINTFDYITANSLCSELVSGCSDIKSIMEIFADKADMKYIEYAKALGTQVQIYTYLSRSDKKYYEQAKQCSEQAINEFIKKDDIYRQYLYRAHLEIEYGKYDKALEYIAMSLGCENKYDISDICGRVVQGNVYQLWAYIRLMAEGKLDELWCEKTDVMYRQLVKTEVMKEYMSGKSSYSPVELILWKYATYLNENESYEASKNAYDIAVTICFDSTEYTLFIIGIAILAEQYGYALCNNRDKKEVLRKINKYLLKIDKSDMLKSMKDIYASLDLKNEDKEYWFNESRKIGY